MKFLIVIPHPLPKLLCLLFCRNYRRSVLQCGTIIYMLPKRRRQTILKSLFSRKRSESIYNVCRRLSLYNLFAYFNLFTHIFASYFYKLHLGLSWRSRCEVESVKWLDQNAFNALMRYLHKKPSNLLFYK